MIYNIKKPFEENHEKMKKSCKKEGEEKNGTKVEVEEETINKGINKRDRGYQNGNKHPQQQH